jgi:DNA (cytosine-5)-methyltransferase 1
MLTFGSLFAGIGGFDLGLERAGMACEWQVEREPYAVRVLEKNWPNVRRHDDVCTFPPAEGNWAVDLICGGFPCQDISVAGKGLGLAGKRSGLWVEMHRIIGELRPRYVIVENVAALLSRGMETVLGDLSEIGYDAEWHVISACAVGAPHRRDRVWIVAYTVSERDAVRGDGASVPPALACRGRDAGGSVSDCGAGCTQEPRKGASDVADTQCLPGTQQLGYELRNGWAGDACGGSVIAAGSQGNVWWETEPAVGRVVDGVPHRVDRLRGLGNAVVPQIVELIGRAIIAHDRRPAAEPLRQG